jgi:hypothetical protein
MRVTIGFWDLVKFKANAERLSIAGSFSRLSRAGVKSFGRHGHKRVRIELPVPVVMEIRMEKILRRIRHCECGMVAVAKNNAGNSVCLKCFDLENRRNFEANISEEIFA